MPNIKAAESSLLMSSDIKLENVNNNNDDNDDACGYDDCALTDYDFRRQFCPPCFRQSVPTFNVDCSNVDCSNDCRYNDDGCCRLGESLDCDCDGLESSRSSCSQMMVNVSCRAVARPSDCGYGYQYQIIDIKTYPETGLLCCPPGNSPSPLDLDSFCKKAEEPPECCPSWSRSSATYSDSFSRHTLPSRILGSSSTSRPSTKTRSSTTTRSSSTSRPSSTTRPSLRSRCSGTSTSYSRSCEHPCSAQAPCGSQTCTRCTRSSNSGSQSQSGSTTEPTQSQSRSSRTSRSKSNSRPSDDDDEQTVTTNRIEPTDDELNENENNVGSEREIGSSESNNNPEIDPGIYAEEAIDDGYSDVDEQDLPRNIRYSSEQTIKSAVLDSLQSQMRSKSTRCGSISRSSKYSDSTPLYRKSERSIPQYEPSEVDEVVLSSVDYPSMSKSSSKRGSSSMPATTSLSSTFDRHQAKMLKYLRCLYCKRELTDITVQVGCSCFHAHRVVLSCYSKYFANRLIQKSCCPLKNTIMLENNISAKTFSAILDFMYTGEIQIDRGNLAKMFTAADFLGINSLKVRCERLLSNGFKEGCASNKSQQLEKQWQQVARNFRVITKTDQFLSLSADCIQRLLCRDDLSIDSEMEVAKAAMRWLNFDREKRKMFTRSVMSCIRFKDLWPEELFRLTSTHQSLLADNAIKEAIFEANWYHTCQQRENSSKLSSSLD